jgi:ATP-dependent helicase/nuclease subunit B
MKNQGVERIFFGWDAPLLPAAAAHLVDHYLVGETADLRPATLVLPGKRARRRIIELLLDDSEARGVGLIPPKSTTVGDLPAGLYQSETGVADEVTSLRAWSHALRGIDRSKLEEIFPRLPQGNDVPSWEELAQLLLGLHQTVAGEGHRFSDVARICSSAPLFDDGPRWRVLATVQERYLRLLGEVGLADKFEQRIVALESGMSPFAGDLWFVSIVELPSVTRRLVENSDAEVRALIHGPGDLSGEAFDDFGLLSIDYWYSAHVPVTDEMLQVVESPPLQAEAVIGTLRGLDSKYVAQDIALSVHPKSEVVPYLEQRLRACNVPPRYAAGTPLPRSAPFRLLEAVADYRDDLSFPGLAALVRHPDAARLIGTGIGASSHIEPIDVADRYFNDHLPHHLKGELPRARKPEAHLPGIVAVAERAGPLGVLEGYKLLSEWMPLIMDMLLAAYSDREWDQSVPAHRDLIYALDQISDAAGLLATLPKSLDEECSSGAAIRTLLLTLRGKAIPPRSIADAVELLDWLEIPLDDAPVVVLTGFNEHLLPESVRGDAFLPDSLRSLLGLTDNRVRFARDAYRLSTVLHSKTLVQLIAGRRSVDGDALVPSRLMFRIPEEEMARRVLDVFDSDGTTSGGLDLADLGLQPAVASEFAVPPEQALSYDMPRTLSVSDFSRIIKDPYRFVLERFKKLKHVDDKAREMNPLVFGTFAHDILKEFGKTVLESSECDITDSKEVSRMLLSILKKKRVERFGENALPAVTLQVEQLKPRLAAFAGEQAKWAGQGWQIKAVEEPTSGDGIPWAIKGGDPVHIRGRIDRIDYNPETNEWALLDYKTDAKGDPPDKKHRKRNDWVDLQLPLYRHIALRGLVDENGEPLITCKEERIKLGYISLPEDTGKTGFQIADWSKELLDSADDKTSEVILELQKGVVEFDPERTKPNGYQDDVLKPLLARGWKASGGDDNDTGSIVS